MADAADAAVAAQESWADAWAACLRDPVAEFDGADAIDALRATRDARVAELGRVALAWRMSGGQLHFERPPVPTPLPAAPSPPPSSAPAIAEPVATPTAECVEPPPPPPDLTKLETGGLAPSWSRSNQTRPQEPADAQDVDVRQLIAPLKHLPTTIETLDDAHAELSRLLDATAPKRLGDWPLLDKDTQRALIGHVVARARRLQDELPEELASVGASPELDHLFSRLTGFSKTWRPGFVYGLRRDHRPSHDTWVGDAEAHWAVVTNAMPQHAWQNPERALAALADGLQVGAEDEHLINLATTALKSGVPPENPRLVRMLAPYPDLLRRHARFKKLRRAIRVTQAHEAESEDDLASAHPSVPTDWPFRSLVQGQRAAIVGGDRREEARRRIAQYFGFSELTWVTTDHARNIQNLATAVSRGGVDIVLVLRSFIGHDVDRVVLPACRASDVHWVVVDHGYGPTRIQSAIERFLDAHAAK